MSTVLELGTLVEGRNAIVCVDGAGLRATPGWRGGCSRRLRTSMWGLISQGASSVNLTLAVEEARAAELVQRLHATFFGR